MSARTLPVFGPRLTVCRLLVEPEPQSGRWNMALDEALLAAAVTSGQAAVRSYAWSQPTVSLGYFQAEDLSHVSLPLQSLPRVRRLTGGGAIVHDQEWTYSCVLPPEQQLVRHPYDLYDLIHEAVIAWFRDEQGVSLAQRGISRRSADEPALCFLREDSHDVCCAGHKVLGSAQRRRRGALLQHGSLILRRSIWAPEVAGLLDLVPQAQFSQTDAVSLARGLALTLGETVPCESDFADEVRQARLLANASPMSEGTIDD